MSLCFQLTPDKTDRRNKKQQIVILWELFKQICVNCKLTQYNIKCSQACARSRFSICVLILNPGRSKKGRTLTTLEKNLGNRDIAHAYMAHIFN